MTCLLDSVTPATQKRILRLEATRRGLLPASEGAGDAAALMAQAGMPPDPWQANVLRSTARRTLLLCSRQSGKSTVTACLALHEALSNPASLVLLLSPSLRQSGELFRKVIQAYRAVGAPVAAEEQTALKLTLVNGSRIVSLPAKEETIRGFSGVSLLVVDEASRVPDSLYYAIRPMLAVSGGRIIGLTTPFGKRGWFYDAWESGGDWERVKITADQCPRISAEFLAEERADIGEWWYAQEYCCEFVDTTDQLFPTEFVMAALSDEVEGLWDEPDAAAYVDLLT